ncbi:MAG: hypothetical protein M0R66_01600 [Candidatus Omnitrophica bacterium]|nr:hypothetical protein [Candidatus Omnitrophota bacterium]
MNQHVSIFAILFLIILSNVFDTINQLFLKTSVNSLNLNINSIRNVISFILKLILIPKVWVGFTFCTLSLLVWLFVLSKADLNYAFPVGSAHYIFIALGSRVFLKEKVGFKRWVGTIFIIAGIIMLTCSNY